MTEEELGEITERVERVVDAMSALLSGGASGGSFSAIQRERLTCADFDLIDLVETKAAAVAAKKEKEEGDAKKGNGSKKRRKKKSIAVPPSERIMARDPKRLVMDCQPTTPQPHNPTTQKTTTKTVN